MTDFAAYVASHPEDKTLQAMATRMEKLERAAAAAAEARWRLLDLGEDHQRHDRIALAKSVEKRHGSTAAHGWLALHDALAALDADDGRG